MPKSLTSNETLPLNGLRVIDLSDGKSEMCGRILADLGADVIMVEPPRGASSRSQHPIFKGESLYFATHNANKRSVVLELSDEGDKEKFVELVGSADILIETGKPGYMASLGLAPGQLREKYPSLIILSISDYGQTGPYSKLEATNAVLLAMGAVLARSGIEGNHPLLPPGNLAHECTAIQASWVALLAYWQRLETGHGNTMDFSLYEATAQILDPGLGVTGSAAAGRSANELAPYGRPPVGKMYPIFPCADGHVRVCVLNPRQWMGMCEWLGKDHDFTDPKYASLPERFKRLPEINALIGHLFADKTCNDIVKEGQLRGVPTAAVATPQQVLNDEHFNARGAFCNLTVAGKEGKAPAGYLEINQQRMGIRTPAPHIGEHTTAILTNIANKHTNTPKGDANRKPLDGLRILDLGVIVAGAELGRLFADQGAEVIKVENSTFADGLRQAHAGVIVSQSFSQGCRNKKSFGLNLRTEKGKELFLELVKKSDAIFSNFKPGTLESLGIDYDSLKGINPGIVILESSALGNTGPRAKSMGYGPLVRASSGLTGLWCYPEIDGSYSDSTTILPDHFAARVAAVGVLSALIRRRTTGLGGKVAVSQAEAILNVLATEYLRESVAPGTLKPMGNEYEFDAPNSVFPCAGDDKWCVIAVRNDQDWKNLLCAINLPSLENSEYNTTIGRLQHRAEIEAVISGWTQQRSTLDVLTALQPLGVPAGTMQRLSDFDNNPHFKARNFFRYFDQPSFPGTLQTENGPVSFSDLPDPEIKPAPFQGQHTRELATTLLGLNEAQIEALINSGDLEDMNPDYKQYLNA